MKSDTAVLSNSKGDTKFQYGNATIRFAVPYSLIRYLKVKNWDDGYLVVDADYSSLGVTEEYIDISDVLNGLYIDADKFLLPIRKVEIDDSRHKEDS